MPRIFISIIFLAGALLLGIFFVRPQWERLQSLKNEVLELEEIGAEFDNLIESRDTLLGLINSISKDNLARVDRMLPQGPYASNFLVSLEALTLQNGMALRRIDLVSPQAERSEQAQAQAQKGASAPGAPRPTAGGVPRVAKEIEELPFNLQVSGSYAGFKKFLAGLERNLRLIDAEDISFSASGKDASLDFTVKAKTYYQ